MCHIPKIRLSSYVSLPDHIVLSISLTLIPSLLMNETVWQMKQPNGGDSTP